MKAIAAFAVSVISLTALLVLTALIPRSLIREHTLASAEYLCDGELFGYVWDDISASRIDRYADSILLGIAWQADASHPFKSVMESAYYNDPLVEENENLLKAVSEDMPANRQYMRYWHGSIAIVRPLLVLMPIKGMYVFFGVLLLILAGALLLLLSRCGAPSLFFGSIAGLIMTAAWFVPFSLEYIWCYLVTLTFSIAAVLMTSGGKEKSGSRFLSGSVTLCDDRKICVFFLLAGLITNYLDFLTAETMTLTVPLLIILCMRGRNNGYVGRGPVRTAIIATISWGAGYVGMWLTKWGLAAVVMKENVTPYITEHVEERLGGDIGVGAGRYLWGSIFNNMGDLLPFGLGDAGAFAGVILILACLYLGFVYRRKGADFVKMIVYAAVGLIPCARYLILHNHAYIHHFFTFRALMGTVLAVALILGEIVGNSTRIDISRQK